MKRNLKTALDAPEGARGTSWNAEEPRPNSIPGSLHQSTSDLNTAAAHDS